MVILTSISNRKSMTRRCFPEKFLQPGFASALDISQRVLFKKSYNGHFFNSLPSTSRNQSFDHKRMIVCDSLPGGIWVIANSFAGIFALPQLTGFFPGITPQKILDNTGFEIDVSRAKEVEPPTESELKILREKCDPQRLILG